MKNRATADQQKVIDARGKDLLVAASAGTGKTTVMIERIFSLAASGALDLSEILVVTFTNLAAAQMKNRLTEKFSRHADDKNIARQLEKADMCAVSTLHGFCGDLLRTYFYVADIDPSFTIPDAFTLARLKQESMREVLQEYYRCEDEVFTRLYHIYATRRRESQFTEPLLQLYEFARCRADFFGWYDECRKNFVDFGDDNKLLAAVNAYFADTLRYFREKWRTLASEAAKRGLEGLCRYAQDNADMFDASPDGRLEERLAVFAGVKTLVLSKKIKDAAAEAGADALVADCLSLREEVKSFCGGISWMRDKEFSALLSETAASVPYTDKMVEILQKFDAVFYRNKKEKGFLDFSDLEHLALKVLSDPQAQAALKEKYKYVFVDEYQDINDVQESILSRLKGQGNMFMVGDVKQSIYGFRGCDPDIFSDKCRRCDGQGDSLLIHLNDNFRSDVRILDFVNLVMSQAMTEDFGGENYLPLRGVKRATTDLPPVSVDVLLKEKGAAETPREVYDITRDVKAKEDRREGLAVLRKIRQYVGSTVTDADGKTRRIGYGDIAVLSRSMKDRAMDVYNVLTENNVPVSANFDVNGTESKEVRDLINFLRVLDNPYNDVPLIGTCLTFGKMTEDDLAAVKIATAGKDVSFYERLLTYAGEKKDDVCAKISALTDFVDAMRLFGDGVGVDRLLLEIVSETDFDLYVQGLPNGHLRIGKMYAFIEEIRGQYFAQSVDKFLQFIEQAQLSEGDTSSASGNAVRMMTIHAAKGLEFPVVILISADTSFNLRSSVTESHAKFGLAMKYYDYDNMKVNGTLGFFGVSAFNKLREREEELRLLYVALTRAENHLSVLFCADKDFAGKGRKLPSSAGSHADWILNGLKSRFDLSGDFDDGDLAFFVHDGDVAPENKEEKGLLCEQSQDLQKELEKTEFVYPFALQSEIPAKVASSALDRMRCDATDPYAEALEENVLRQQLGVAYHKVYEFAKPGSDEKSVSDVLSFLTESGQIEKQYAGMLDRTLLLRTLNNPDLLRLAAEGKTYHELPFMLKADYAELTGEDKQGDTVLQGVIDLLILQKDKATVVDFKYTTNNRFVTQNYRKQLHSYRLAVQRICGIEEVETYVLSIRDNKMIKIT